MKNWRVRAEDNYSSEDRYGAYFSDYIERRTAELDEFHAEQGAEPARKALADEAARFIEADDAMTKRVEAFRSIDPATATALDERQQQERAAFDRRMLDDAAREAKTEQARAWIAAETRKVDEKSTRLTEAAEKSSTPEAEAIAATVYKKQPAAAEAPQAVTQAPAEQEAPQRRRRDSTAAERAEANEQFARFAQEGQARDAAAADETRQRYARPEKPAETVDRRPAGEPDTFDDVFVQDDDAEGPSVDQSRDLDRETEAERDETPAERRRDAIDIDMHRRAEAIRDRRAQAQAPQGEAAGEARQDRQERPEGDAIDRDIRRRREAADRRRNEPEADAEAEAHRERGMRL